MAKESIAESCGFGARLPSGFGPMIPRSPTFASWRRRGPSQRGGNEFALPDSFCLAPFKAWCFQDIQQNLHPASLTKKNKNEAAMSLQHSNYALPATQGLLHPLRRSLHPNLPDKNVWRPPSRRSHRRRPLRSPGDKSAKQSTPRRPFWEANTNQRENPCFGVGLPGLF